jgi:hypothetical protein
VTLAFTGEKHGVRDERMGKNLGDGIEFSFEWPMNQAIVLSFAGTAIH